MDGNVELLNYIHQNSEMGTDTIEQLLNISKDDAFKGTLKSQLNEYKTINEQTIKKLKELGKEPKDISPLAKATTYLTINFKTLADKSSSHISQMMIQGSTMGIIDITKKLNEYSEANKEVLDLANKLLAFEQRNVEECKRYLH